MNGARKKQDVNPVENRLRMELDRALQEVRKLKGEKRDSAAAASTAVAPAAAAAAGDPAPSPATLEDAAPGEAQALSTSEIADPPAAGPETDASVAAAPAPAEAPPAADPAGAGRRAAGPAPDFSPDAPARTAAPAASDSGDLEALQGEMAELRGTKQRLSRLYFRQVEESRQRAQKLHRLLQDICEIGPGLDLDAALARLAVTLRDRMGFRVVLIRLREPGTDLLRARGFAGLDEAERAALEGEDVRLDEFQACLEDEFRMSRSYYLSRGRGAGSEGPEQASGAAARGSVEWREDDVLLVPIYGRGGDLLAYFSVGDPEDRMVPSLETIGLLELLANLAGGAIENAHLYRRLDVHTRGLEASGRRAQEIHSLRNDFISTVSHEVRAALTAIRAHVDTLRAAREDEIPWALQQRFLGVIHEECERVMRHADSMLDLNRFDAAALRLERETVDLSEILNEAALALAPSAREAQVDLKAQIEAADTRIDADRGQIRQLVLHLGGNALKFTPRGGHVTLRLSGDARDLTLQVEDSGAGIPEPLLQKIVGRFHQVDSSLIRGYGGAGLGLAICRSIVEWHGGRVLAESLPGQGSRFTVVLPRRTGPRVLTRPGLDGRAGTADMLRMAIEMVAQVLNARVVSLLTPEGEGGALVVQAALGLDERVVREASIRPGEGVAGWVAEHRRPVCVAEPQDRPEGAGPGQRPYRTGTFLSVPLEDERGLLGVLNVADPISEAPFDAEDCHLALHLAQRLGEALRQAAATDDPAARRDLTAQTLRGALLDLEHGRHSAPRHVLLARATARALGLPESEVGLVGFAAGRDGAGAKSQVAGAEAPGAEAPGPETAGEGDGVRMGPLEVMGATREMVLTRREWWDGSGYPGGLEGEAIPVGGRVLAVADAFERMSLGTGRRAPLPREEAIRELRRLAGTQFDPEVVDAFERALAEVEQPRWERSADSWEHASATQGGE